MYLSKPRTMITVEVRRRECLTPDFASVTLGGPAVRGLVVAGRDQVVRRASLSCGRFSPSVAG